jgi:2-methylisocitrate lyase-like PEP mutase family enzyme
MTTKFEQFNNLHRGFFVLPNVWNAKSASVFQQKDFPAIATSSSAVAESLGYEDGEQMPFNSYLFIIRRIIAATQLLLSVDLEMGYGLTAEDIYTNILSLIDLGVVGINLEDSAIHQGTRFLDAPTTLAQKLETIKNRLVKDKLDLFINVRCDTYLLDVKDKQNETKERVKIYENSGADGIFLPCIREEQDIASAVNATRLPLNVMYVPGLPDNDTLQALGVKRVSMGTFAFNKAYETLSFTPPSHRPSTPKTWPPC